MTCVLHLSLARTRSPTRPVMSRWPARQQQRGEQAVEKAEHEGKEGRQEKQEVRLEQEQQDGQQEQEE